MTPREAQAIAEVREDERSHADDGSSHSGLVAFGEFVFDLPGRKLRKCGALQKLGAPERELLAYFVEHPGQALSRDVLLAEVWQCSALAYSAISVTVAKLRKVLGTTPEGLSYIESRYGRGYRFVATVTPIHADALPQTDSGLIIGRSAALRRLRAALERTAAGRGALCALIGEPGIGKTRLGEVLPRSAPACGVRAASGSCAARERLAPWRQVLSQLGAGAELEALLRSQSQAGLRLAGASVGHAPEPCGAALHRTSDAIAQALHAVCQQHAVLLHLDDLHAWDAESLRVLDYLIDDLNRRPLLIVSGVCSTALRRSGTPHLLRRVLGHRNCERIELGRLREAEVALYLTASFAECSDELVQTVFERSDGNPALMVELLRPFLGRPQPAPEQLGLTEPLAALLNERLQKLSASTRRILGAAAAIGRNFDVGMLARLLDREPGDLLPDLDEASSAGILRAAREAAGVYAFEYGLLRDLIYGALSSAEKNSLHARAADALLRRRASGCVITAEQLAKHLHRAPPGNRAQ